MSKETAIAGMILLVSAQDIWDPIWWELLVQWVLSELFLLGSVCIDVFDRFKLGEAQLVGSYTDTWAIFSMNLENSTVGGAAEFVVV
jgi:hypothetical protein